MKLFTMYRIEPLADPAMAAGGVGGKVTVDVLFVPSSFDPLREEALAERSYRGKFTGVLLGILTGDDKTLGRMFFEGDIEVIYDPSKISPFDED